MLYDDMFYRSLAEQVYSKWVGVISPPPAPVPAAVAPTKRSARVNARAAARAPKRKQSMEHIRSDESESEDSGSDDVPVRPTVKRLVG